ncbi:MAG: hypothetical protein Q8807_01805 ['Waltheria sp.' little leaf phytoplasma]|nr:hypothetical protein ['Waltheria sp.' little leaf phytoplasma]
MWLSENHFLYREFFQEIVNHKVILKIMKKSSMVNAIFWISSFW